jgi:hypothetical protein
VVGRSLATSAISAEFMTDNGVVSQRRSAPVRAVWFRHHRNTDSQQFQDILLNSII